MFFYLCVVFSCYYLFSFFLFFFFNDRATTEIYTLSLHDALPISPRRMRYDGISVCSEMMRVASCSADISSEKKPTIPPLTVSVWPSGRTSPRHARAML